MIVQLVPLFRLLLACYTQVVAPSPGLSGKFVAPVPFPSGKVIDTVLCKTDPSQSYALYIPRKGNKEAMPVIYFFDPHGDGALPLRKYRFLAEAYGFILIGSNNSKNGNDWPTTENIWRHLSEDTRARLKINGDRIYTGGFSGGAKVAGYVALQHPGVKGVIANGAGLPDGSPAGDFPFSFTAIAGRGDMNLTELVAISKELDKSWTRHRLLLFDGKHEWAPENCMHTAFAGLQFDAMRAALLPKEEITINDYILKSKRSLDTFQRTEQWLAAKQECEVSIGLLDGLTREAGWFKERSATIAKDPRYQRQRQEEDDLLAREQNIKAAYTRHFREGEGPYWTKTINDLQRNAKTNSSGSAMDQRLLSYLSLAFYSISNHLIAGSDNSQARQFVEYYKIADPTNSEAWYFSAILHARDNQVVAAENDLQKARKLGFRDKARMKQQPEFQKFLAQIHF